MHDYMMLHIHYFGKFSFSLLQRTYSNPTNTSGCKKQLEVVWKTLLVPKCKFNS
jgi:hypothetical protein